MATTTQEQLDSNAKEFAEGWPADDTAEVSQAAPKNPAPFYTAEEMEDMKQRDRSQAQLKG